MWERATEAPQQSYLVTGDRPEIIQKSITNTIKLSKDVSPLKYNETIKLEA